MKARARVMVSMAPSTSRLDLTTAHLRSFCTCRPSLSPTPTPPLEAVATSSTVARKRVPVLSVDGSLFPPTDPSKLEKKAKKAAATKATGKPRKPRGFSVPKGLAPDNLFQQLKEKNVSGLLRRPSLANEHTARDLVREWGIHKMDNVTVVDAYAGPGAITRALLELSNVKKVIAIEESFRYQAFLEKLVEEYPDRLVVRPDSPFQWETYTNIEQLGLLDDVPQISSWETPHPSLFFVAQLPHNKYGDQQLVQFCRAAASSDPAQSPSKNWYFKYGRMQMGFIGSEKLWQKILAKPGSNSFHKLAVTLPAVVDIQPLDRPVLTPLETHFHKSPSGTPALAALVTPKDPREMQGQTTSLDTLEYVTKTMFIGKASGWKKMVPNLSVGAGNLIPKMIAAGAPEQDQKVNALTLQEWIAISEVFDKWPFRPEQLEDLEFQESY